MECADFAVWDTLSGETLGVEDKARKKEKAGAGRGFNWFAILLAAIVAYGGWILWTMIWLLPGKGFRLPVQRTSS